MGIATTSRRVAGADRRPAKGFTLVELLVVIGIIALLISILLPSLNKARSAANTVKCKANLHSIGEGLLIYANSFKGTLPYGAWDGLLNTHVAPFAEGTAPSGYTQGDYAGDWTMKVFGALNSRVGDSWNAQYAALKAGMSSRGMFICPDAPSQVKDTGSAITHYACHPRLMPQMDGYWGIKIDGVTNQNRTPYKIAHIHRSQEVILIFDASLSPLTSPAGAFSAGGSGFPVGNGLDGYAISQTAVASYATILTDLYGVNGNMVTGAQQVNVPTNTDPSSNGTDVRFRHNNNTVANTLFVDGHVGQFQLKNAYSKASYNNYTTDLLRRNVNVNP